MRHNIKMYSPYDFDEVPFVAMSMVTGLIAFFGLVATFCCIGAPGWYFGFSSLLPGIIHLGLTASHCGFGFGGSDSVKGQLAASHHDLPRKMRKEIPLTRQDIKVMSNTDASGLRNKIDEAISLYHKVDLTRITDAHSYLDSYLDVRKELG